MLNFLPGFLKGPLAFLLFGINTVIWCSALYLCLPLKLIPVGKHACSRLLNGIGQIWVWGNSGIIQLTQKIDWNVEMNFQPSNGRSYLVLVNHRSWVDIVVLQWVFNTQLPFPKFFIKKQLFWVPFLGAAWWGLDFPFMQRYSKEYLQKHPEKKGKDLETTKERCRRFKDVPTTILIFAEGTRFSKEKQKKRKSPYQHLLPPKAGGLSAVMQVMGEQFHEVLDVTIIYPQGTPTFWHLFSGKLRRVAVRVDTLPVEKDFLDKENYPRLKDWVEQLWAGKDRTIDRYLSTQEFDPGRTHV